MTGPVPDDDDEVVQQYQTHPLVVLIMASLLLVIGFGWLLGVDVWASSVALASMIVNEYLLSKRFDRRVVFEQSRAGRFLRDRRFKRGL